MTTGSVLLIGAAFMLMGIAQAVTDFVLFDLRERRNRKMIGRGMHAAQVFYDEAMRDGK